jgi:hypothetical protein
LWLSAGAIGRIGVRVIGPIFLEAEGGAVFPLVRDRFFVEPDETIHRAPAAAWSGAAGLGVTIW